MGHSTDLRIRVLSYLSEGGVIKTACALFKVSRSSIQRWRTRQLEQGHVLPNRRIVSGYKIDETLLRDYVLSHPDAYLDEIAAHFGMSSAGILYALKRFKITRKKRRHILQKETKKKDMPI
jgi:transposase